MPRVALLALAVALVLADSSVVTLGLPAVLGDFDASPQSVSWVLTAYNLVLAAAALPAAFLVRQHSATAVAATGLALFAAASLLCALAPSLGVLIAARCLQGLGGAAVACAALPLLTGAARSPAAGAAVWGASGAIGAAVGPAAGGALTEAVSWQAIFAVQVPIALVCLLAVRGRVLGEPQTASRPDVRSLAALGFVGAGLTAALFLLVLLLIAGWRESPLAAAATVSVMPVAALLAGRLGRGLDAQARAAAGAVLVAGGLTALAFLPDASLAWTIAPQILIGLGLGLALAALTEAALHDRTPQVVHGAWTIAARHAGVVAALALLTPVFVADLERQEDRAEEAILATILDSPVAPTTKLELSLALAERLNAFEGEVPDLAPAFAETEPSAEDAAAFAGLRGSVDEQLDRAAKAAFVRSFLIAAVLSLGALLPLLLMRRRP